MALRVLIVDDDLDFRQVLSELLSDRGRTTHTVGSGTEMAEALESFKPQTIILDLNMPHMDGVTVLKHVQAGKLVKTGASIIVVTGSSREDELSLARSTADRVFNKPIVFAELMAAVDELAETRGNLGNFIAKVS